MNKICTCLSLAVLTLTSSLAPVEVASAGWLLERDDQATDQQRPDNKKNETGSDEKLDQAYIALEKAYQKAITEYTDNIKQHWKNAELTSQNKWVTYSVDFSTKRVVDFEGNEIRISFDRDNHSGRVDFIAANEKVRRELVKTLSTTVKEAFDEDPVDAAIRASLNEDDEYLASLPDELILSELFENEQPTERQIDSVARKLLKQSVISYQQNLAANTVTFPVKINQKLTYRVPLPKERLLKKAEQFRPMVHKNAEDFEVTPEVLFAIMHTESHFNPMARSPIPAYGLMQIVPRTAGKDASKKIYDKPKLLSPKYLYNPENNIKIGSAYLNLLYFQYLKGIANAESRLYCMIAAYNAGTVNVAKAFVSTAQMSKAVPVINQMSPSQVLDRLMKNLPSQETRDYLMKVLARQKMYSRV